MRHARRMNESTEKLLGSRHAAPVSSSRHAEAEAEAAAQSSGRIAKVRENASDGRRVDDTTAIG